MHALYKRASLWTELIIGAAIEVHRHRGPGLLESIYEACLVHECSLRRIPLKSQVPVPVEYKGVIVGEPLYLDVIIDDCLIVELKSIESVLPIHKAQVLTYMKLTNMPLGLLINFNSETIAKGLRRMILPGADAEDVTF